MLPILPLDLLSEPLSLSEPAIWAPITQLDIDSNGEPALHVLEGLPVLRPALMAVVSFLFLAGELALELVGGGQVRLQGVQV